MSLDSIGISRIALDLGTANTLIHLDGRGLVMEEPSMVRLHTGTQQIESMGRDAKPGAGRTPPRCETVRPVRNGQVCDPELCGRMLNAFLRKVGIRRPFRRLLAVAAIPGELSELQKIAVVDALRNNHVAGALLVDQVLASAQGAGMPIHESRGHMLVDVGAGITEVAVISMSNIVASRIVPIAGDEFDAAIESHVRTAHHLLIGQGTAERVKIELGAASPGAEAHKIKVKGRCLVKGIPREVVLSCAEILDALSAPINQILLSIREVLHQTPPELSADLLESGIVLTGGSAHLSTLAQRIGADTGLPVVVAGKPHQSVILGLAHQLERLNHRDWRRFGHPL